MRAAISPAISAALCILLAPIARAQFAVIDVGAITQLISEVQILEDQLITARNHLAQAQAEYQSITGGRGMQNLLATLDRNYLPANWGQLQSAMQAAGGLYSLLAREVARTVSANSMLTAQDLEHLPPALRAELETSRRLTALQQSVTRQALADTSARFASLQQLIDAIGGARDQKAVLDLQARIGAETTLMQNDQSKLLTLFQLVQSEKRANQERMDELALLGQGQFATRFQPVP